MRDDRLKRGIHFVCGFVLGAPVSGAIGYSVAELLTRRWGDLPRASDIELWLTIGLVGAVAGGLVVGRRWCMNPTVPPHARR
jgi:hypothetical protein